MAATASVSTKKIAPTASKSPGVKRAPPVKARKVAAPAKSVAASSAANGTQAKKRSEEKIPPPSAHTLKFFAASAVGRLARKENITRMNNASKREGQNEAYMFLEEFLPRVIDHTHQKGRKKTSAEDVIEVIERDYPSIAPDMIRPNPAPAPPADLIKEVTTVLKAAKSANSFGGFAPAAAGKGGKSRRRPAPLYPALSTGKSRPSAHPELEVEARLPDVEDDPMNESAAPM